MSRDICTLEFMYNGQIREALSLFTTYMKLENVVPQWNAETAIILNYIAYCFEQLGELNSAEMAYMKAITYMPHCREPLLDLSDFYHRMNDIDGAYFFLKKALKIPGSLDYMYSKSSAYSPNIPHLAAFFADKLGKREEGKAFIELAMRLANGSPSKTLVEDYAYFNSRK